ncbi:cytochrome c [Sansalvadorimonas sp. 2012CJ34-2]|uniref:Cytochrome c n=1 Tax=Parendozoicomonas callyspongiae TaxID=2942213 RepID=A0ABT0PH67_9GAMM|nr:cytochrome c [Sansalvadorimonas sp. 2012CJ34-2]MCL6270356.1 cytochrome c [Sansalvadorimonas sp. 2012CJ34-2]
MKLLPASNTKLCRTLSAFIFTALASATVQAVEFAKDDDAVYLRKAHMALVGTYFGEMGAMVKGKQPFDAKQFQTDVERLATVTRWAYEGFKGKHLTSDSKAKPEIWENKAEFNKLMDDLAKKSETLKIAAASGNLSDIKPAFKDAADSCSACHKKFKNK